MAIVNILVAFVTMLRYAQVVIGYPNGPPLPNVCDSMFPTGHGVAPQISPSPFVIKVYSNNSCYGSSNNTLYLSLSNLDPSNTTFFEGFMIEARLASNTSAGISYGNFGTNNISALSALSCFNSPNNNVLAHNQLLLDDKGAGLTEIMFTWTPSPGMTTDIQFLVTVVHETPVYWLKLNSPTVRYNSKCAMQTPYQPPPTYTPPGPPTYTPPGVSQQPTTKPAGKTSDSTSTHRVGLLSIIVLLLSVAVSSSVINSNSL